MTIFNYIRYNASNMEFDVCPERQAAMRHPKTCFLGFLPSTPQGTVTAFDAVTVLKLVNGAAASQTAND